MNMNTPMNLWQRLELVNAAATAAQPTMNGITVISEISALSKSEQFTADEVKSENATIEKNA